MTICTDVFEQMATLEKRALGKPDMSVAIVEHPLVYRTDEELEAMADSIVPLLEARFQKGRR